MSESETRAYWGVYSETGFGYRTFIEANDWNGDHPMPKFKPARVTFEGIRYEVQSSGEVYTIVDGSPDDLIDEFHAARIRAEATRQRRNRDARSRAMVMRSVGLKRTAYGWE